MAQENPGAAKKIKLSSCLTIIFWMLNLNGKETFKLLPSNFPKLAGLETLIPFPWKRKCSFSDIEINEAKYIFKQSASQLKLCFRYTLVFYFHFFNIHYCRESLKLIGINASRAGRSLSMSAVKVFIALQLYPTPTKAQFRWTHFHLQGNQN